MQMDVQTINRMNKHELAEFIEENKEKPSESLLSEAVAVREKYYGKKVFVRGLIEFTNYCKNNCYYCGIRNGNKNAHRYRLSEEEIMACADEGHRLGFNTYVLQGGEDSFFTDKLICDIVYKIKSKYPECAVTLSIGEKNEESYRAYRSAGADRYLLRHETANNTHYGMLHPSYMSLENRKNCLYTLRNLGYQIGAGFMVSSPYQTSENLAEDLLFLKDLQPHMVGIGPFIPHKDTQFANEKGGTIELTLTMLALVRLMLPKVLLPSTTALGTIDPMGREKGFGAGANVVMPNLSPTSVRKDYSLYDNKICTGDEAAQCILCLKGRIERAGYEVDMGKGDSLMD
jgi:biotin synthase